VKPNQIRKEINDWLSQNFHRVDFGEIEIRITFHSGNIKVEKVIKRSEYYPAKSSVPTDAINTSVFSEP
jgi:hypothetical protein